MIKKNISEFDIFFKHNKWPFSNILIVAGSKGKTYVSKYILKKLRKKKFFKKIIFMDRNKITFSNIPFFKEKYFLILEMDYQNLILTRKINARFKIFTSYFKNENK